MTDGNRNGNFVLKAALTFQNFMLSNWDESPSWVTGLICATHIQYFLFNYSINILKISEILCDICIDNKKYFDNTK